MSTNALGRSIESTRHDPQAKPESVELLRPATKVWCAQCNEWHAIPLAGRRTASEQRKSEKVITRVSETDVE
jgi:hypothetical protein